MTTNAWQLLNDLPEDAVSQEVADIHDLAMSELQRLEARVDELKKAFQSITEMQVPHTTSAMVFAGEVYEIAKHALEQPNDN